MEDGALKFIQRVLARNLKEEELPTDYKDAVTYVLDNYIDDSDFMFIICHRYGFRMHKVWMVSEIADFNGWTNDYVNSIMNHGVSEIRNNWSAKYLLTYGLEAYYDRQRTICKLASEARMGDRVQGLIKLFEYLTIHETRLPISYCRAIGRSIKAVGGDITALQYIMLLEDDLLRIRSIGVAKARDIVKYQKKFVDTYSNMSLDEFRRAYCLTSGARVKSAVDNRDKHHKDDGHWCFIEKVLNKHIKYEDLPEDYVETASYVARTYLTDEKDFEIFCSKFGLNAYERLPVCMIADNTELTESAVHNRLRKVSEKLRADASAVYILTIGVKEYACRKTVQGELLAKTLDGREFEPLMDLLKVMHIWEVTISTRLINAIMRGFEHDGKKDAMLLDFMLLTSDSMLKMRNIGRESVEEALVIQKRVMEMYSVHTVEEFQNWYAYRNMPE